MNPADMPKVGRMERKKEETRQNIIRLAMEMFRKQGVDGTTMEQIAEEADIAKGTLYNYFPVKEAIISDYIQQSFQSKKIDRLQGLRDLSDTRTRVIQVICQLMNGVQAQPEIFEKYMIYRIKNMISLRRVDAASGSGMSQLAIEIIRLGQEEGEIRSDLPLEIMVALFEFVFVEVTQEFYIDPERFNQSEVIEQCVDLFINGVKSYN